jgi:hypothetical protein
MDRKYIDDHHVVARYLADQLSDGEREAFEAYYVEHPGILPEMEAVARLKTGLRGLQARGQLDALMKRFSRFQALRFLVAAAALLISVGLVFFLSRGPAQQPLLAATSGELHSREGDALPIVATHTILRTRGVAQAARIEIGEQPASVEMLVLPEYGSPQSRYRLSIATVDDDGRPTVIGELQRLAMTPEGFVRVFLNTARIVPGQYQLLLEEEISNAPVSLFAVEVAGPAAVTP